MSLCVTIVTNRTQGRNCSGTITDEGHNLDDGTTCGSSTANDSLGNTNPQLDPAGLADNGGPTQTIALLPGSPAINAGDADVCARSPVNGIDQRGYVRPGTGYATCSIGAYEYMSPGPPSLCAGDCRSDGAVTIDELITLVNVELSTANISTCTAGDTNHDGQITINEIIIAVNAALNGSTDPAEGCVDSGGQVTEVECSCSGTPEFYATCGVGARSCPPTGKPRHLDLCVCGSGKCWNGSTCIERVRP